MTPVYWELLSGEQVENLAALLILQTNPNGNQVTPSRGDGGIDFRIRNEDRWDVYQVKKYCRRLTSAQAREIERSWQTFVNQTPPTLGRAVRWLPHDRIRRCRPASSPTPGPLGVNPWALEVAMEKLLAVP